jgi:hypothetical protein
VELRLANKTAIRRRWWPGGTVEAFPRERADKLLRFLPRRDEGDATRLQQELTRALTAYRAAEQLDEGESPAEVRAAMRELARRARPLAIFLPDLSARSRYSLARALGEDHAGLDRLAGRIVSLWSAAEGLAAPPGKPTAGARPRHAEAILIVRLAALWENWTGTAMPSKGNAFLHRALKAIAPGVTQRLVTSTLRARRKSPPR